MGLFGLLSRTPKSSASGAGRPLSGGTHHDRTPGRISRLDFQKFRQDLHSRFSREKAERIAESFEGDMDQDRHFGASGARADEISKRIKSMKENPYDGIDADDVKKIQGLIDKRM